MSDKDKNIEQENVNKVSSDEVKAEEVSSDEVKAEEVSSDEVKAEEVSSDEVKAEEVSSDEEHSKEDKVNSSASFLLGKKIGMTSVYSEDGLQFPTTIIEAGPCYVSQLKTLKNDGYEAVQIGYKEHKKANKPKTNHFKKANVNPMKHISEFRVQNNEKFLLGEELKVNIFNQGDYVKVSGVSKGKGFAGVMKRHGFAGGRASHGKNSVMRKPGSVGAGSDPSRIWKGKKMPGRYGGYNVTCKNLEILKIDLENNLLFIKGSVPGANNGLLTIYR
ncbi:MAG: 50S ribosomal protein L3 [Candidatus Marinimicrobia bacterium]|nr:50S ribosomal protein L3 [Candidatus Neomarinimicrobiota bacterium]